MADPSRADQFEIQAVERSALPGEKIVVRIRGRWRGRERPESEGILVVEQKGREYRFFANPAPRRARFARPGTWIGSFALPASLALDAEGQLSLHFGLITIPLPSSA